MPSRVASTVSQNQNAETMYNRGASRIPRPQPVTTLAVVFFVLCLGFSLAWSQNDVLTQHNDNTRAGLNSNETLLTPANVTVSKFGKLFTQSVDGIMGTPVIDPGKTTLYVVAKTLNNSVRNFSLHALDITTGSERLGGPVIITGTAPSSNGSGTFNPIFQMQRPALLLQNGVVYIGFGGNGCDLYAYNGWFFAYNSQTLQEEFAFLVTPNGKRGSIWQGGSGPAADADGYIYVATATGDYDGPPGANGFGDSVLKMGWNGNVFGVLDFFTPYNETQLDQYDLDLGSSGPLVLPDQPGPYPHLMVAGGKEGTLYLINRDA